MRIGVLTTSYPRAEGDPAGAFVAGFTRWLAAQVGEVEVLCADEARPIFYRGGAPSSLGGRGLWHAARFSSRLVAEAARRQARWDAIVSHWLVPAGAIGLMLAGGRPHLSIAHGSDVRLLDRLPGGRAFIRTLARQADLVYVARALTIDGAPGRVVPMAVDVAELAPNPAARTEARRALGLTGFVALFVGRLSREKGADLAIAALPDGMTLLIAGDGPERRALEALAKRRALSAEANEKDAPVRFFGEVRGARKRELFAAADALIVPSRQDGAPTVILEGLAAGLPMVATTVGGIPELVQDGETALLCAPRPPAIARALSRLAADPALAGALAARARAAASAHDWSVVGPRLAGRLAPAAPPAAPTDRGRIPRLAIARV
jgi:glycosyltransferase involved in cell wall biosynthesis